MRQNTRDTTLANITKEGDLDEIAQQRNGFRFNITINRPARRNAMSQQMWRELGAAAALASRDTSVRVVVIRGAGDAFSAGADISEFESIYATPPSARAANAGIAAALAAVDSLTVPAIAVVRGPCMGGGVALAAACDLQLADPSASFGVDPGSLGLAYRFRDCQRLAARIGIGRLKQLLMGGKHIDAATALSWGLVSEVVPPDALDEAVDALAARVARRSATALRAIKATLNAIDRGCGAETAELRAMFDACFVSDEFRAATTEFLDRRS